MELCFCAVDNEIVFYFLFFFGYDVGRLFSHNFSFFINCNEITFIMVFFIRFLVLVLKHYLIII